MEHNEALRNLCMFHILEGLCGGLSHFSGPSRAAVIYAETPDDPMRVYDPQDLLRGHEPKLKELYADSVEWRSPPTDLDDAHLSCMLRPEKGLQLAGLISYGGRSRSIFYQMWFTEHHPDVCSTGPTERWLEHAACLLAHDYSNEGAFYLGTSRYVLREYATHAVRDHIRDELNILFGWDVQLEIYPILDAVLGISKTPEEGVWPRGMLVFVEPAFLREIDFLIRFPLFERLRLKNFKHVRKLMLAVENSERKLVSDGSSIVGVATGPMPRCRITADYQGGYGFLSVAGSPTCSFSDGSFHSSTRRPNLVQLEEVLIESAIDPSMTHILFKIVMEIVSNACNLKHGCSIVLDFNDSPVQIAGQPLERPPDLREDRYLDLAKSLAKVDGALHIGADLRLHAFACLLDGLAVVGEDRARGARFNSALRFTARHENLVVIVVSSDRPVSVIQGGVELTAQCEWNAFSECILAPAPLSQWIEGD
mgnify:CR=1 FL=1